MSIFSWALILGVLFFGSSEFEETVPETPSIVSVPEIPTPLLVIQPPLPIETTPLAIEEARKPEVLLPTAEPTPSTVTPATPVTETSPATTTPAQEPVATPLEETNPEPEEELDESGSDAMRKTRNALVNIICTSKNTVVKPMSGSGVFIDDRGIILTVAHVGQYFLLADGENTPVSCIIRTGSPARNAYIAKALYVSESWVTENPTVLLEQKAKGTGEHDFALLAVTESATGSSLPSSFPALSISKDDLQIGSSIIIGSYGAQFISSADVVSSLYPTLIGDTVKDVYTFRRTSVDVLSLGGNAAAQLGSSGGAVTDTDGNLVGLITTSSIDGPIHERNVRAITPKHIRKSFADDTRAEFDSFLRAGDLEALRTSFLGDMEKLRDVLTKALGI